MTYVLLDGKWHELNEGGVLTACGVDVPYGSDWQRDEPDKLCRKCAKAADEDEETAKPAVKATKA